MRKELGFGFALCVVTGVISSIIVLIQMFVPDLAHAVIYAGFIIGLLGFLIGCIILSVQEKKRDKEQNVGQ
jgi:hypothetical protein